MYFFILKHFWIHFAFKIIRLWRYLSFLAQCRWSYLILSLTDWMNCFSSQSTQFVCADHCFCYEDLNFIFWGLSTVQWAKDAPSSCCRSIDILLSLPLLWIWVSMPILSIWASLLSLSFLWFQVSRLFIGWAILWDHRLFFWV